MSEEGSASRIVEREAKEREQESKRDRIEGRAQFSGKETQGPRAGEKEIRGGRRGGEGIGEEKGQWRERKY